MSVVSADPVSAVVRAKSFAEELLVLVQRPEPPPYDSDDEDGFLTEEDLRPKAQGSMGILHLAQRIGFS